jgi:hypothetical protein
MRAVFRTLFCFALCGTPAIAQSPVAPASGRVIDVSLGYSYISHADSFSNRVGLNGADASFTMGINPRLAIRGDLGYARAADVLGSGRHSDVFSYMAGPVLYMRTAYFDASRAIRAQNNIRTTATVVYFLGKRFWTKR